MASASEAGDNPAVVDRTPLLLDTDIGTNIDDALALAYLLREPRCELLGITTVNGDVARRAAIAEVICRAAGREDVPIHRGAERPLGYGPEPQGVTQYDAVRDRPHRPDRPAGKAAEFMRQTVRGRPPGEVTLLTVGPLTNVALLFALDPEVPAMLNRVVSMAGVFFPHARRVETNCRLDPAAAAAVLAWPAGPARPAEHTLIGLDVTDGVRLSADEARERFRGRPPLDAVLGIAERAWFPRRGDVPFHDPLAAMAVFAPGMCDYARGRVSVDTDPSSADAGRTVFVPAEGCEASARVALRLDAPAALLLDDFLRPFG